MGYKRISRPKEQIEYNDPMYKKLQELEDKIENGTLIELPCKVGDKAYFIYDEAYFEFVVDGIMNRKNRWWVSDDDGCLCGFIGETVFLTKAEAQAQARLRASQVIEVAEHNVAIFQKQLRELKGAER